MALVATICLSLAVSVAAFSQPNLSGPLGSDKVFHAIAFAVLAFPMAFAYPKHVWWVVGAAAAYGGVIELVQPYAGRQAEWLDFWFDLVGALVGGVIGFKLGKSMDLDRPTKGAEKIFE